MSSDFQPVAASETVKPPIVERPASPRPEPEVSRRPSAMRQGSTLSDGPPVQGRELAAIGLMIIVVDLTLYRAAGFAAPACLFLLAPAVLLLGMPVRRVQVHLWFVIGMLGLLSLRLLWSGSVGLVLYGVALTVAFAMSAGGVRPFVLEGFAYAALTSVSGLHGLIQYCRAGSSLSLSLPRGNWMNVVLPAVMCCLFAGIFVLANPDLAAAFGDSVSWFVEGIHDWLSDLLPHPLRIFLWCVTGWLTIGLLRPVLSAMLTEEAPEKVVLAKGQQPAARHYEAFRNTLATLIGLFAVYLLFEFATLWFREFPEGFYYAGYAHEGAAWLTVALAMATMVLSSVFRGDVLTDSRVGTLHRLAWIWSFGNLLLALAVYNRLGIYVGFNGMTRMRMVGFFGVTTVVVGFIVVLWKIHHARNFLWLVRRQLWTVVVAGYLFLLTPVDRFVVAYNTRRVLGGDPAACMQIGVQRTGTQASVLLLPLLDCEDPQIRDGVQALLAEHHALLKDRAERRTEDGWTAFQLADWRGLRALDQQADRWSRYTDEDDRAAALQRFYDYAYQWY